MNAPLDLPPGARILVVALRRLGDVLLTTPLIRSLRRAWPDAQIDALVFSGTAAILDGNPDLSGVIPVKPGASASESFVLIRALWQQYDLAITTQAGDRPTLLAIAAGRRRVGLTEARPIGRIKRTFLHRAVPMDARVHRVEEMLALARAMGIAAVPEVVCPDSAVRRDFIPSGGYAVIHAAPQFTYKRWHESGWRTLARHLADRGLAVVASGGPGEAERRYLDALWTGTQVQRMDGALTWPELTALIRGAAVFVGADTSVTHLAAATGTPVVAIFGPTDPRIWGPWPAQGLDKAWQATGTIQRRGNVRVVQDPLPCVPCQHEGCLRHLDSYSRCLDELSADAVIAAVNKALTMS